MAHPADQRHGDDEWDHVLREPFVAESDGDDHAEEFERGFGRGDVLMHGVEDGDDGQGERVVHFRWADF